MRQSGERCDYHNPPRIDHRYQHEFKQPNTSWQSKPARFRFNQAETLGANTPEAYEQIVKKILQGDKSLFPTMSELSESCRLVTPMLAEDHQMEVYPVRTLPRFAQNLATDNGFTWFD